MRFLAAVIGNLIGTTIGFGIVFMFCLAMWPEETRSVLTALARALA